ncbi:L,D-transpeptidase [Lichenihabitans sp. Uapishka_5]|uniref:L,D-transpeptidase n=1 Tax=Lichenihabitans sp. Uapishka_5 TaxID=3037302 RepID=UPI0029E7F9F7|nr:L,D-transpeptidase [Lichenihabitans sp. Uapishka_5]MDX7952074.1 L,D-transpeptidase [Lichenihabitans sp. Uapishka_5]
MRIAVVTILAALCGLLTLMGGAEARVRIAVDLGSQTMRVSSASGDYLWPISSARTGFNTPRGTYGVQRLEAMHRSHKYHNSPMPHSIFFKGGYAIHGTYAVGALGQPASHGCIRLAPENAAALYQMVRQEGAQIAINGTAPAPQRVYADGRPLPRARMLSAARANHGTLAYATSTQARHRSAQPVYAADGQGFYLRPVMSYAPQPRGLGEWLMDPAGW